MKRRDLLKMLSVVPLFGASFNFASAFVKKDVSDEKRRIVRTTHNAPTKTTYIYRLFLRDVDTLGFDLKDKKSDVAICDWFTAILNHDINGPFRVTGVSWPTNDDNEVVLLVQLEGEYVPTQKVFLQRDFWSAHWWHGGNPDLTEYDSFPHCYLETSKQIYEYLLGDAFSSILIGGATGFTYGFPRIHVLNVQVSAPIHPSDLTSVDFAEYFNGESWFLPSIKDNTTNVFERVKSSQCPQPFCVIDRDSMQTMPCLTTTGYVP